MKLSTKGYQGYQRAFKAKVSSLLKRDLFPAETKMLSEQAWRETYKATRNTLKGDVRSHKRKVIGNVNQYIIQQQVYSMSSKQAKAYQEAAKSLGKDLSVNQIRTGEFDVESLREEIRQEYRKGRAEGMSTQELSLLIGQFYFGSD